MGQIFVTNKKNTIKMLVIDTVKIYARNICHW